MKKRPMIITILLTTIILIWLPIYSAATPPPNSAVGAVLMEVKTGRVLYAKNPHKKMPMASTTKIMTAILAIENSQPQDIVKVSPKASGVEGSSLYLATGETLTMEQLLYGLMLRSGNDAAAAIAEHLGETVEGFAEMMNKKAQEIGALNTNFVNPHGLHHDQHYTTAYDLALISSYAMKKTEFQEIVSTKYFKIPWEGQAWDRTLMNKNALLWSYEGANGIKTGYTRASGRCLASAALRDDMQLVATVINCQPWFDDSASILDFGFNQYKMSNLFAKGDIICQVPVKDGFQKNLELILEEDISLPLTEEEQERLRISFKHQEFLKAPVTEGTKVGSVQINLGDEFSLSKDLYAGSNIKENTFPSNLRRILKQWMVNTWTNLLSP